MSSNNFQEADLTTRKLFLSLQIATMTGPNGFGESLNLQFYAWRFREFYNC